MLHTCNIPTARLANTHKFGWDSSTVLLPCGSLALPVTLILSCSELSCSRLSLFFSLPLLSHHTLLLSSFQSSTCAPPVPPITSYWALWVCHHLQPALKLHSIIHYLLPLTPKSIFVLSPAITHRDMILTLHNIMADVSFFTLQLLLTMTTKIPFSFLKQRFYCISQENLC